MSHFMTIGGVTFDVLSGLPTGGGQVVPTEIRLTVGRSRPPLAETPDGTINQLSLNRRRTID